jgi:hypothetical protein
MHLIDEASARYKDRSEDWHPNGVSATTFRGNNTWGNESIRFLGVFDTVGALGAPFGIVLGWIVNKLFKIGFHDNTLSPIVESAYHALALDERRLPFLPTLMTPNDQHNPTNFEQKWFPGVHSDIGGGYEDTGLSDLALEWMADKARLHGLNLDLTRIHSQFKPNVGTNLNKSQKLTYRVPTILTVKLPGKIGLVPKRYTEAVPHISWNGDYVRPLSETDVGDLNLFIGRPASRKVCDYQGCLHIKVIEKINDWPPYEPINVSRLIKQRAKAAV